MSISVTSLDDIEFKGVDNESGGAKRRPGRASQKINRDGFTGELRKESSLDISKKRASVLLHMHEVQLFGLRGNPIVVAGSVLATFIVVIIAVLEKNNFFDYTAQTKSWVTFNFTWFFIGAQNVWVFFIAYIWLSPSYAAIKIGGDDSVPEYNTVTWFMMMFGTAGSGTGLVYYGVGEPIFHLSYNRYVARGYLSFDQISQIAINLAYYHWGIHAWMCYTIVGISMGIMAHRMGLPLTIRSGLFPIFGKYVFGWFGDMIDALSIFTTLFAICTSMGVGAIQINTGLNLLFGVKQSNLVQVILIALMTVLGGISAHAGLKRGVRVLSILTFCTLSALAFMVLFLDDTTYLLNLLVQSFGYHIQHIIDLGFYSDAFEQLNIVVDKKSGPDVWMDWWTVFYWSWWVSWSPFVGMFIAKISKGRTVREVINASLTGPVLFNMIWFAVFGGAGLRMERLAIRDGCLGQCTRINSNAQFDRGFCDPLQYGATSMQLQVQLNRFKDLRPGGCESIIRPSTRKLDQMWFDVLSQYENVGEFMIVLSLFCMILSVISTNDSGSIILNIIGSNGPHGYSNAVQKQIWSFVVGAVTIVMIIAGGNKALTALQTVIVVIGLPYTIIVCILCYGLKIAFDMELHSDTNRDLNVIEGRYNELTAKDNGMEFWSHSILSITSVIDFLFSFGAIEPPSLDEWKIFGMCLIAPWWILGKCIIKSLHEENAPEEELYLLRFDMHSRVLVKSQLFTLFSAVTFNLAIIFFLLEVRFRNFWVIGFTLYMFFACVTAMIRNDIRHIYNVEGDVIRNIIASVFYPLTLFQMWMQLGEPRPKASIYRAQRH
uniref:Uncharacterized protein n=1 Tax=Hanusia phi TaxID=3032 RepID=A0A7S0EQ09_9CRYP|mmetsp:Transcript_27996/g.63313  ORF Transcript_27996/g.63313 Transcript_27996/m.63313 type:complete len:828 (+) Transcript_27996:98-2581(+)